MVKKKSASIGIRPMWDYLLNLGVKNGLEDLEIRKIRLLNSILIIGQFIFFVLLIKSLFQNLTGEVYPQLVGAVLFAIPLILNFSGSYRAARVLCVVIPYLYLMGLSVYWGESRGSQLIIFGSASLAILFFEDRKMINSLFIIGMLILIAAHIVSWNVEQFYFSPSEKVSFVLNLVITAIMIYFIFNIFKTQNYNYQKELSQKNKSITDSIHYAGRIQSSILGDPNDLKKIVEASFIFYKPKDIVSGDFYWFAEKEGKKIIVASDCTGHGVPGAFMTVLGTSILNEIINERKILDPAEMLKVLDDKVRNTLQGNENIKSEEGMDIGIIVLDETEKTVTYAGANHTLYFIQKDELKAEKANKLPIGGSENTNKDFQTLKIDIQEGDTIYLVSDGFQDQFSPAGKKYMRSQFRNFLHKISSLPITEQSSAVDQEFTSWKGHEPQTDDVLVIGIKL
ncbi:MAG: SpoIIE family protein phosphatase [bacterium]|nr:SpoIIE family protein phosphatase [bacterium]